MDNEKLDRIVLLLENINSDISDLKQDVKDLKQGQEQIKSNLGVVMEALNASNRELSSKIATIDKKVNITAGDILELKAAK